MYTTTATRSDVGSSSGVLRNTYMLLSITVLWSALTAYLGMSVHFSMWGYLGLIVLGFVFLFATMGFRNSALGLVFIMLFTGVEGLALGPVLNHYLALKNGTQIVFMSTVLTGGIFAALSGYVLVTRKDFSFLGGMLFGSLILLILASIVAMFFPVPGFVLAISCVSALVFCGLILYDTSAIIHGGETNYIMATIALYLDILNLFSNLLRIYSFVTGDD